MKNLLQLFNQSGANQLDQRSRIVERLLKDGYINTSEATLLLKTIDIKIEAQTLEMSSGAKIVGGSDFETTSYDR